MILVQYYVFVKYFNQPDTDPNASNRNPSLNERYQLPDVSFIVILSVENRWRVEKVFLFIDFISKFKRRNSTSLHAGIRDICCDCS